MDIILRYRVLRKQIFFYYVCGIIASVAPVVLVVAGGPEETALGNLIPSSA